MRLLVTGVLVAAWTGLVSTPAAAGQGSSAQPGGTAPQPPPSGSTGAGATPSPAGDAAIPDGEAPAAPAGEASAVPAGDAAIPDGEAAAIEGEVIEVQGEAPLETETATERTIDGETLAQATRRSADELLRLVPGLHISQHASEGKAQQFFLRGFDAVHGSDLELQVAGIPINESSNVHGHGYVDVGFVIPEVVSALRARKGSFDLAQGAFATAGTVELELGVVAPLRGQRLSYEVGSTNRHRLLALAAPRQQPEQTFVAVEAMSDDGFGENRATRRFGALSQARFELGTWGRWIDVMAGGYAARFGEPGPLPLDDYQGGAVGFYDSYDSTSHGLSYRALSAVRFQDEGDRHRVSASAWAMWRDLTLSENYTGYLINPVMGDERVQRHSATTLGAKLELSRDLVAKLALVGGASLQVDLLDQHEDQVDEAGVPWQHNRELGATQSGASAFVGARAGFGPDVRAEAGGRVDAVWIRADDRLDVMPTAAEAAAVVSPRASLSWRLSPATSLHAAYGRGLRPPEARSITGPAEPPPDVDVTQFDGGEPRFTTSDAAEIGGRTRFGALSAGAGLFGIWISNEMVFDHISGLNLARNATRRLGAEVDVEFEPWSWLLVRGDLSAVDARFVDSGAAVPSAPRLLATAEAYARPADGWRAGAHVTFLAARPLAHGAVSGAQTVVDLVGSHRRGRFELGLQIDNALGQKWREGEYHFASQFDRGEPRSMLPRLHFAPGRPFGARVSLTVWL